jgi:predicted metal-dependent hydrolase
MIPIDKLLRSQRKTLSLVIERDGQLLVRAPMRASESFIREFVAEHEQWIRRKQEQARATYAPFKPKEFVDGEGFWYLGDNYKLQISDNTRPVLALNGRFELSRKALSKAPLVFERWYRGQARRVLAERVERYAGLHGFTVQKVKITSARMRWGSCSSKGTLNFAWRLVMAPLPVIDYVVVHELVHLRVKNHSKKFWAQVGILMPEYKTHIQWLKVNGHLLNLE